jgi:hypothetical protein
MKYRNFNIFTVVMDGGTFVAFAKILSTLIVKGKVESCGFHV